jgi:hypothetical protein
VKFVQQNINYNSWRFLSSKAEGEVAQVP